MSSRLNNSLRNAKFSLFLYLLNIILQFLSRKVFIDNLGTDVLGLNSTIYNLVSFINLAELGISSAVAFTLYKPLATKDLLVINEIVSLQGWLYRRISYIMIVSATILLIFFPLIFNKVNLPIWYTYASFIVVFIPIILGYVYNYSQIILVADQQEYKVNSVIQGTRIIKLTIQISLMYFFNFGFLFWLATEFLFSIYSIYLLNNIIKKTYPWFKSNIKLGNQLKRKYPIILTKTKQLFFHQISGFALTQTSPLIIYSFLNMLSVVSYGNYMIIVNGIIMLMTALTSGIHASVGNLLSEGNIEKNKKIFWEYAAFRFYVTSIICFCFLFLVQDFITIWVGPKFLIDDVSIYLIIIYIFIMCTRVSDPFIFGYGLYGDIYAPIIELLVNIILSIILGYYFGLPGIIGGIVISLFLVIFIWKPMYLFIKGFQTSYSVYFIKMMYFILLILISSLITFKIQSFVVLIDIIKTQNFIIKALLIGGIYTLLSLTVFTILSKDFRYLLLRLKNKFI